MSADYVAWSELRALGVGRGCSVVLEVWDQVWSNVVMRDRAHAGLILSIARVVLVRP